MKRISFLSLIMISALAISAFTFCSNGNAKTSNDKVEIPGNKREKAKKSEKKAEKKVTKNSEKTILTMNVVEKDGMTWYTDLQKAHEESSKTGKPILGFFTGSDWCGWCFKLHDNVLVKEEFIAWAEENVVLMEIDFPRRTKLDPALQEQNNNLQRVFQVSGFPTVWYFTSEKNEETGQLNLTGLGKTGYPRAQAGQEATQFIAASEAIISKEEPAK